MPPACSLPWDNFSLSEGFSTLHVNLWGCIPTRVLSAL